MLSGEGTGPVHTGEHRYINSIIISKIETNLLIILARYIADGDTAKQLIMANEDMLKKVRGDKSSNSPKHYYLHCDI